MLILTSLSEKEGQISQNTSFRWPRFWSSCNKWRFLFFLFFSCAD